MAKPLQFLYNEQLFSLQLGKVDRAKLYGFKEIEAVDEQERVCELATLCGDGKTLVGRGGTAVGYISPDGQWCDRLELTPVDVEGSPMEPVPSSFDAPIDLKSETSVDDYLEHKIRLIYRLDSDTKVSAAENSAENSAATEGSEKEGGEANGTTAEQELSDLEKLREQIGDRVYRFPFRYRAGIDADVAFILANEENELFLMVGTPTRFEFIARQQIVIPDSDDDDQDELDFDMI